MTELDEIKEEINEKLDKTLLKFSNIALNDRRMSFWEKFAPIIIPTIISTIIGVSSFYAAFNLSEYKISVLMTERSEIKQSIKNIEKRIISFDLSNSENGVFISYNEEEIEEIQANLCDIRNELNQIPEDNNKKREIVIEKINKLENRIIRLEGSNGFEGS